MGLSIRAGMGVIAVCLAVAVSSCARQSGQSVEESEITPTIQDGMTVQIEYTLTVDGEVVDSSEGSGPLSYVHGQGQIIPGLERQLAGMSAGESADVIVSPEEGYGLEDPKALVEVPKEQLPTELTPEVGVMLRGASPDGRPFQAKIHQVGEETVTLDVNHPLAGKTLTFNVEVVEVSAVQ